MLCYVLGPATSAPRVPDLAIEVVWTSGGIGKFDAYRKLGVPEVWFWEQGRLSIFVLHGTRYQQRSSSTLLPEFDAGLLSGFMQGMSQTQAVRAYRQVLREEEEKNS